MIRLLLIVAAPLVLACGTQQDASVTSNDSVALSFNWPAGMRAQVDVQRTFVSATGGRVDSTSIQVTYDLNVVDHPTGRQIQYSNFQAPQLAEIDGQSQRLAQLMTTFAPGYTVSTSGQITDVDINSVRADLLALVETIVEDIPSVNASGLMDQLLSDDALRGFAAQEWTALVGFWNQGELALDAVYQYEAEEPLPMIDGAMVPFQYDFGAARRLPCTEAEAENRCVELIMKSQPDAVRLGPILDDFIRSLVTTAGGRNLPSMAYKKMQIENEIVLVTEPNGLIPHTLTITKFSDLLMEVGGTEQGAVQIRMSEYTFTYPEN